MATLRDIRKRIGSVKNTQKITKAMKMVAAAKLRRAQNAVLGSRPFSNKLKELVVDIAAKSADANHPLLSQRESIKTIEFLVFTSNRGLCGGFNSNLLKAVFQKVREYEEHGVKVIIRVVGRKGVDFFRSRHIEVAETYPAWADEMTYNEAAEFVEGAVERYTAQEVDECYLVYNKFISAISADVTFQKILSIDLSGAEDTGYGVDYIYEPQKEQLLLELLPKYLATQVYKAHLESLASELGARMSAMDSATNNAKDMIGKLTLQYNRARQAAITVELMDIVNGAESLKG